MSETSGAGTPELPVHMDETQLISVHTLLPALCSRGCYVQDEPVPRGSYEPVPSGGPMSLSPMGPIQQAKPRTTQSWRWCSGESLV